MNAIFRQRAALVSRQRRLPLFRKASIELALFYGRFSVYYLYKMVSNEVMSVVYTIEQLKERITPIAEKYQLRAVWVFGSYARGEATENSDVDILIDRTDSIVKGWIIGGLYNDLSEAVGKPIDLVTIGALEQESTKERTPWFVENLNNEKVKIYG